MDGHDGEHRLLAAFLAGDLDPAAARRWDEHLLECEQCWRAVREDRAGRQAAQVVRGPGPPGLADRVAFAVEVAAAGRGAVQALSRPHGRSRRPGRHGRRLRWRLAVAGALAASLVITLVPALLLGGRPIRSVPKAVAAVARYAQTIPPPARPHQAHSGGGAAPRGGGPPARVAAGGPRVGAGRRRAGGAQRGGRGGGP